MKKSRTGKARWWTGLFSVKNKKETTQGKRNPKQKGKQNEKSAPSPA
jgi:hypothetical protein